MEERNLDIDISGEDELPAGVQPGTLSGTDEPPPERTTADDLDADFDAALEGDYGGEGEPEPEGPTGPTGMPPLPPPGMNGPAGPPIEAPSEEPKAEEPPPAKPARKKTTKRTTKKKTTAKPAASNNDKPTGSGPAARHYAIFQKHQVEVDGLGIVEAFVRVSFANPDDPQGDPLAALRARNRDMALHKAGKLFGHGFEGTLVATPVSMWEEKPVRNKPREEFKVQVGDE